jgi:S-adenosylmethionine synthetase
MKDFMFTSESVTAGHPDKLCDQISDAIVDHFLSQDPYARVRAECAVAKAIVFIAARFSSSANIDFARLTRKVIQRIGYDHPDFNPRTCSVLTSPQAQPENPDLRFDESRLNTEQIDAYPAHNQVTVFGYACNHTTNLMPLPIALAHRLARQLSQVGNNRSLAYAMPDGRVQVGVEFVQRKPKRLHSISFDVHADERSAPSQSALEKDLMKQVVEPVFASEKIKPDKKTLVIVNPEGAYAGGPMNHSGLTGRKNAVDTYGDFVRQGSKALSGKDPMRIDRAGAYMARYAAKNIVAAGLAGECEVMISYASGFTRPITLLAQTYGTSRYNNAQITRLLSEFFDFRPMAVVKQFQLRRLPSMNPMGFYQHIAAYGHFGREDVQLPWEQTDLAEALNKADLKA